MSTRESDPEVFARRLSELREASGRSYGALSRRMGVSASTLHRYCSGHTVPMEFAPVERLARLCGCRGEELVGLHRLWVRADADRRRRQETAGSANRAAARGPEGAAGAGGVTDSAGAGDSTGAADSAEAADSGADGPGSPAVDDRAAAHVLPSPDPGPPVSPPVSAPDPAGRPEVTVVPGEGPPPAARVTRLTRLIHVAGRAGAGRRRAAYVTAAVLTAVLTLVLLPAFDRSPLSPADRQRALATEPVREGAAGTPSGSPGPARSPGAAGTPPPGKPQASPGGGARTGPVSSGKPSGGVKPGAATGVPFTWSVNQHVWENACGHTYLVNREPDAVPPPPGEPDAEPWARSLGAVHGGETMVRITAQGRKSEAVVLQALHVRVAARRTPPERNAFRMDAGCGGSLTPRMFEVNLDKSRPVARSVAGNDAGEEIPAVSLPYWVSAKEPEVLLVTGRTVTCDCDWYLELEWSAGGRTGTVRIDDNGRPFRTSGVREGRVFDYDTTARRWIPAVPATPDGTGTESAGDGFGTAPEPSAVPSR